MESRTSSSVTHRYDATSPRPGLEDPAARSATPSSGPAARDGRTLADLIKELRDETTTLMRQEVALAKTEMSEKAAQAGRNIAYLGTGAAVAYAGALVLLVAVTMFVTWALIAVGADRLVSYWLGPLIVGVIVVGVGAALVYKAIDTFRDPQQFVPDKTVDSMQENTQWAKEKITP